MAVLVHALHGGSLCLQLYPCASSAVLVQLNVVSRPLLECMVLIRENDFLESKKGCPRNLPTFLNQASRAFSA